MEYDKKAGISTFAMRIGAKWAVAVYGIELLLPFVWIVACALCGVFPWWSVLALIAVAPAAANVKKSMRYEEGGMSAVIGLDEQTAKLQLLFGMLLFISFLVPVIFFCISDGYSSLLGPLRTVKIICSPLVTSGINWLPSALVIFKGKLALSPRVTYTLTEFFLKTFAIYFSPMLA